MVMRYSLVDVRAVLLQILLGGDSYGLEIMDKVKSYTNGEMTISQASVYPLLRELETGNYLESYERPNTADEKRGRPRRYYRMTDLGRSVAEGHARTMHSLMRHYQAPASVETTA